MYNYFIFVFFIFITLITLIELLNRSSKKKVVVPFYYLSLNQNMYLLEFHPDITLVYKLKENSEEYEMVEDYEEMKFVEDYYRNYIL